MTEIPKDIIKEGRRYAFIYAQWLHAGNSTGSLSEHAVDGLADTFSRAIQEERERNSKKTTP